MAREWTPEQRAAASAAAKARVAERNVPVQEPPPTSVAPATPAEPVVQPVAHRPTPAPTPINLGLHTNPNNRQGNRMVKMARPVCVTTTDSDGNITFTGCQDPTKIRAGWWESCTHEPYFSLRAMRETKPQYETLPDGRQKLVGEETVIWHEKHANLAQIPVSQRINNGRAIEHYRTLGFKFPEEIGFAPFCQFNDCWSQNLKFRGSHGDYCSEMQAKLIAADENEDKLEILNPKKRKRQLAALSVD